MENALKHSNGDVVFLCDQDDKWSSDKVKTCLPYMNEFDLIIHDAQYSTEDYLSIYVPKQGFGHSTFEMALDCKRQVEAKKIVFFHYDPCYNDEKLDLIIKELELDEKDENSIRTFVIVLSLIAQASAIKKLVQKIVKEYHS